MEQFFTSDADAPSIVCTFHGRDPQPHCRHCANYQYMVDKYNHQMAETTLILASLGYIKWEETDGLLFAKCSIHAHDDMREGCSACQQLDAMIQDGSWMRSNDDAPAAC